MRNLRFWILTIAVMLLLVAPGFPASRCPTASGPELLLPAESTVTVAISSLDELETAWQHLSDALTPNDDVDLRTLLLKNAPALGEILDSSRSQAAAFRIYPVMFQRETAWTYVMPLLEGVDPTTLLDPEDVESWAVRNGHLILSNLPEIETVTAAPVWWDDMLPGVAAAHMDLGTLIEENRGTVEMGLATLPLAAEQARQQAEALGEDAPATEMPSAEQMEGLATLARLIMDSLTGLDAAADVSDDSAVLRTRFDVRPDSPLAAGPQPEFGSALELTRRLPRQADIVAVSAFDQSRTTLAMEDFSRASMRESYAKLVQDPEALETWLDGAMKLTEITNQPWAGSFSARGSGIVTHFAVRTEDATEDLQTMVSMIDLLPALGLGRVESLPDEHVGPTTVHVRSVAYDFTGLAGASVELDADDVEEMQRLQEVLDAFTGEMRLAAHDGLVLITTGGDAAAMTAMVRGGGRPHDRIAALAAQAGPHARQVLSGDYGMILDMMADLMGKEAAPTSVPFTSVTTADGPRGAWNLSLSLDGLKNAVAFLDMLHDTP